MKLCSIFYLNRRKQIPSMGQIAVLGQFLKTKDGLNFTHKIFNILI